MDTRRDFLKKAIVLSGTAGLSNAMPSSIKRALSIDPPAGSTYLDAEHVVILMQENRSFDHCFGALRGVRGFNDPRLVNLPDGNIVWLQSNKKGETYAPFRFDIRDTKATWMGSIPHGRASQVDADNYGRYDYWLEAKRSGHKKYREMPLTLGHYNRDDLPFNYSFADAFTICDQNFCSGMTSTWPNRKFLWTGTVRGEKSNEARAFIRNISPMENGISWKTFPELLEESKISWKIYQNTLSAGGGLSGEQRSWMSNFGCNPLEHFSQYNVRYFDRYVNSLKSRAEKLPNQIAEVEKKLSTLSPGDKGYDKYKKELSKKKEVLADTKEQLKQYTSENFEKLTSFQRNLYQKAFTINDADPDFMELTTLKYEHDGKERELPVPKGDFLYQFRKDVDTGQLPAVSWMIPSQNFSDHPSAPWYGAWLTSEILDILTKNPEVWKKTIFILTYDENDGYFDHIPPYVAPDYKDPETGKCSPGVNVTGAEFISREQEIHNGIRKSIARTGPIGLGFRVPLIIASPWSRGGKVCSQIFDHTSTLQFLEHFLNKKFNVSIKDTNISQWRRTVCGDLTSVFDKFDEKKDYDIDFLKRDAYIERIYNAKFQKAPNDFRPLTKKEIAEINKDPASSHILTHQEPGKRVARPLPYELYVNGGLSDDKKGFQLNMKAANKVFGDQAAGSPFKVYVPKKYKVTKTTYKDNYKNKQGNGNFEVARSWDYAVTAGDELSDNWPLENFENNNYHFRVYAPNGFFREFMGNTKDPDIKVSCEYQHTKLLKNKATGNVEIHIKNMDHNHSYELSIKDNSYKNMPVSRKVLAGGEVAITLDLKKSFGWYDFTVSIKNHPDFSIRYAGHVETGKESYSDPAMGREV